MNIKILVLLALEVYVIGAISVLAIGFLFGDPNPDIDSAQSLLNLNNAAQASIADRTNQQVDQVVATDPDKQAPKKVTAPKETSANDSASTSGNSSNSSGSTAKPAPKKPNPTPTPSCGQGGSCTTAQVAAHGSQGDCWVIYNSKAYNVTPYAKNQHPGGSGSFDSSTCGTNVTAQLKGQAGSASAPKTKNHPASAYDILNSYFVANISG